MEELEVEPVEERPEIVHSSLRGRHPLASSFAPQTLVGLDDLAGPAPLSVGLQVAGPGSQPPVDPAQEEAAQRVVDSEGRRHQEVADSNFVVAGAAEDGASESRVRDDADAAIHGGDGGAGPFRKIRMGLAIHIVEHAHEAGDGRGRYLGFPSFASTW